MAPSSSARLITQFTGSPGSAVLLTKKNWISKLQVDFRARVTVRLGSISTELRCPRYVRSPLNFEHNV